VAGDIFVSLRLHTKATGRGAAYPDGIGYAVPVLPSGRQSFSPDASSYAGPRPANRMRFIEGPPTFAVEVRSENDYGPAAEADIAAKRADYFAAGTLVVWDVDPLGETITAYGAGDPAKPAVYRPGDVADAESGVPGWRVAVRDVFAG
jgi:Uma2 family endonuclease